MTPNPALRPLPLPEGVPGRMFLTAMPGRFGPLADLVAALRAARVGHVLCLAGAAEVAAKSPDYAQALATGALPARWSAMPVADFGAPADAAAFTAWLADAAALLRQGEAVALHCAAGIGRTGTAALCLLHLLGVPAELAAAQVQAAGAGPETPQQREFVAAFIAS